MRKLEFDASQNASFPNPEVVGDQEYPSKTYIARGRLC